MLIIILVFIIAYLLFFNKANKQDKNKVKGQGGIAVKYSVLIQYILSYSGEMKILQMDDRSILISHKIDGVGNVSYSVLNSFNKVYIKYTYRFSGEKPIDFNWEYQENYNQQLMIADIHNTITDIEDASNITKP